MARRSPWRWLHGIGLLVPTGLFGLAAILFLTLPDALVWPSGVIGTTYRADAQVGTVSLTRRNGRWEGEVSDFPIGTATHFAPDTYHGFFVVHLANDRIVALSDRSPHRGQRVYWYDPRPSYDGRSKDPGFGDRDYGTYYAADGLNIGGPAPRPLDSYPLTIEGERLSIESLAECPPNVPGMRTWCRDPLP
jgi:Rieske Fe-S protein